MVVLLTGAAGFIGSQLAKMLTAAGCEVHVIIRPSTNLWRIQSVLPQLTLIEGDLANFEGLTNQLAKTNFDLCIHTAWYAKPSEYLRGRENLVSLNSSISLLTFLTDAGCKRFVGLGSEKEYDARTGYMSEDSPVAPGSLYGTCKFAFHRIGEKLTAGSSLSFAWARVFNLFGPGENHARLLPDVITGLLEGRRVRLTGGEQIMDFLHVEDVASAIWRVACSSIQGAVNIGSGMPLEVKTLVQTAAKQIGGADLLDFGALPYNPMSPMFVCANNKRLRGTGWTPKYTTEGAVADTVRWWKEQQIVNPASIKTA